MALVRFDPFRGLEGVSKRMSQFLDEFDKGFTFDSGGFNPRIDISEDEKLIMVQAELPGMKKSDLKIRVNDENVLTIEGEKFIPERTEGQSAIKTECCYGKFQRSFLLPDTADADKIEAKMKDGLLDLRIPKKEPEKPKEKEISIL
ncbi:MAG: Hsp20/alpha crystallin family protein [Candidatus Kapaibacterium sp.]